MQQRQAAFVPTASFTASSFTTHFSRPARCFRSTTNASTLRQTPRATVPIEADAASFKERVIESSQDLPVLVDFYAAWCGPCKLVAPLMEWAATEYDGKLIVVKVDTEDAPNLVKDYKINGLPTLAVFKKGEAFAVTEGAVGKKGLIKYIDENVFSE